MSAREAVKPLPIDHAALPFAAALAAFALGCALEPANGYYTLEGGYCLVFAFVAPCLALLLPRGEALHRFCAAALPAVLAAALVLQASMLTSFVPAKYLKLERLPQLWPMHTGALIILALALAPNAQPGGAYVGLQRLRWPLAAVAGLAMGLWLVQLSPAPHIDVFEYTQKAAGQLWHGINPYASRYADVYGSATNSYAKGLSDGKQTLVGFPYLPLNLWVLSLGYPFGDPRLMLWGMMLLAAGLVAIHGPSPTRARLAAACMLLTPRCMFLLEQSFLEPIAIALVAATAIASNKRPHWLPALLGALLVTKQPMPLFAACAWLLPHVDRDARSLARFAAKTFGFGCAWTLPLLLLDPQAFYRSAIWVHFAQLRAPDSLTLATYVTQMWHWDVPPLSASIALLAVVTGLVLVRARATASSFCICFGLSYLAFLLFARQAYANYHHQVLASFFIGTGLADFGPRKVQR